MADELEFLDPDCVAPPLGPYRHVATVPAAAELVFISGQIGIAADGTVAPTIGAQADQAFANLCAILDDLGLDVAAVVKLGVFIVAGHDTEAVKAARVRYLGEHRPTSTTLLVPALLRPEWLIEVEAVAARRPSAMES